MGTFHLLDLNAEFLGNWTANSYRRQVGIEGAQGVIFQCPKCAEGKEYGYEDGRGFYRGAHSIICWFRNPRGAQPVPPEADPKPGRWWIPAGSTDLENLTFEHGEPFKPKSILLIGGCNWHGYVENGIAHD